MSEIPQGAIRFNTDSQKLEFYAQGEWWVMSTDTPNLAQAGDPTPGARGFAAGGTPSSSNMITAVNLASSGKSFDFANLTFNTRAGGCGSSNTRAIAAGGLTPSVTNTINIWTMASASDATDFGDLVDTVRSTTGVSNSVRVTFAGGLDDPTLHNDIQTVLFASQGGTIDFGALTNARSHTAGVSNSVRAVIAGGEEPSKISTMDFFLLATGNDAQEFGDLSNGRSSITPTGDKTRGVFMGGEEPAFTDVMEYVTFSTTGNTTNFGDLSSRAKRAGGSSSNCVRGFYFGGSNNTPSPATSFDDCDSIIIQEESNSVDFGDLHTTTHGFPCSGVMSNGHGGL